MLFGVVDAIEDIQCETDYAVRCKPFPFFPNLCVASAEERDGVENCMCKQGTVPSWLNNPNGESYWMCTPCSPNQYSTETWDLVGITQYDADQNHDAWSAMNTDPTCHPCPSGCTTGSGLGAYAQPHCTCSDGSIYPEPPAPPPPDTTSEPASTDSESASGDRVYKVTAQVRLNMYLADFESKETAFRTAVADTTKASVDAVTVISTLAESASLRRMLRRLLSSTLLVEFEVVLYSYEAAGEAGIRLQQSYFNTELNSQSLPTAEFVSAPAFKDVEYTVLNCSVCADTNFLDQATQTCTACPENSRTELTLHATDISECVCEEGYTNATPETCSACSIGLYKDSLGNVSCTQCPTFFSTTIEAADTFEHCVCVAGRYRPSVAYLLTGTDKPTLHVVKGKPTEIQHSSKNPIIITDTYQWQSTSTSSLAYAPVSNGVTTLTVPLSFAGSTLYYFDGTANTGVGFIEFVSSECVQCEPNLYKDFTGDEECGTCPQHMYSLSGADAITDCECDVGYIGPSGGPCSPCEPGTFKSVREASICELCPVNTHNVLDAATDVSACLPCPAFTQSGEGSGSIWQCVCQPGYAASLSSTAGYVCTPCAAGSYQAEVNSTACQLCAAGKFSSASAASSADTCQECAAGEYTTVPGTSECLLCPESTWQDTSQADATARECTPCPSNSSHSLSASTSILDCVCHPGFWRPEGSLICQPCTEGYYCEGGNARIACPVNQWSYSGAAECSQCPANSESLVSVGSTGGGLTSPDQCQCNPGFTGTGGGGCTICPAGTFQSNDLTHDSEDTSSRGHLQPDSTAESFECEPCSANQYQDAPGQTSCIACPANSESLPQSDAITDCTCSVSYVGANGGQCELCPAGFFCPGGEVASPCRLHSNSSVGGSTQADCLCVPGYYSLGAAQPCNKCLQGYYCPGDTALNLCSTNSVSQAGANAISDCVCVDGMWRNCIRTQDGRYLQNDGSACTMDFSAACVLCGANDICFNSTLLHCPLNSRASAGSSHSSHCICNAGYFNTAHDPADHDHNADDVNHEHHE